jgi:Fe-S oxidoreductase
MAAYKAEALHQTYARRRRPRSHYTLGRLPRWVRLTAPVAPAVNRMLRLGAFARVAKATAGIDRRRALPELAPRTLRRATRDRGRGGTPDVWIWADSFTDHLAPHTAHAAIRLLGAAGLTVRVIDEPACCGLTWVSTGQLDAARRIVAGTLDRLHPYVADGVPVVGLEPSCLAALRGDLVQLTDDPRAVELAGGVRTLAEVLASLPGWSPPDLSGTTVVVQPHCHHASVLGWAADERLLRRTGAEVVRVGGCCGLAGNFGVEKGHYEVSVAIAEHALLPAVRAAGPDAVVLADGFSCRTQLDDLAGVKARHLSELLLHPLS